MKVLHVTSTDPAGSVINFVNALNRHTDVEARAVCTQRIEDYDFPRDYGDVRDVTDGGAEIEQLLIDADVIHLHKVFDDFVIDLNAQNKEFSKSMRVADYVSAHPKKVVHHIHGHPNERDPEEARARAVDLKARGWKILASTPDLEEMYRGLGLDVSYFPNCVPVRDVLYMPRASNEMIQVFIKGQKDIRRFMVYQSPTNSILKNVSVIRDVVDELARAGLPVFYWGLMNSPQDFVLRYKRAAHIVFDHIEGYYGLSSLEGLSMGKPTIAGLSDYTKTAIAEFFGISDLSIPWVIARNRHEVMAGIQGLVENPDKMWSRGAESRRFMTEIWSDRNVGQRLAALYRSL